jgi:putative glutamine amidotransferase
MELMHRIRIGITTKSHSNDWLKRKAIYYLDAIRRAGAEPIVIAPDKPNPPLSQLSGLLIAGGSDVTPELYGQQPKGANLAELDPARDELEIKLIRQALGLGMPLLGICRGMQIMNVALGGQLIQDIKGHIIDHHEDPKWLQHDVQLAHLSHLAGIFQRPVLAVNSRHHQSIDPQHLGRNLKVTAYSLESPSNIEAIEVANHPWAIGVQWHPERNHEVPPEQAALFNAFYAAAQRFQTDKKKSLAARRGLTGKLASQVE